MRLHNVVFLARTVRVTEGILFGKQIDGSPGQTLLELIEAQRPTEQILHDARLTALVGVQD